MTRRIRRAAISAAATALAATVVLAPATRADAIEMCRIDYQCSYSYYSDAQHTTMVGWRMQWCDGTSDSDGRMTHFIEFTSVECNDGL